jgi:pyruvate-formate lyase-activating enzyme
MPDNLQAKQAAVEEVRHWVRLTRACNNRCSFCLDSGAHDGQPVPLEQVKRRIDEGRARGATRLILSGGEPTIHPAFLDLIRYGGQQGYTWIQCVTNGRMFSYERFARDAMGAGLREATFSMHAHDRETYKALTGVDAFVQALRGLTRLIDLGAIVSVDIVLTSLNLPRLKEILEFYIRLGVLEFDLLQLVPFGRGFDENRDTLFPDPETTRRELARALELADTPGLFLWTNRLPIALLEGHEDLFQDPHKLYDEVLGERQAFRELFANGTPPECLGDRCPHCFLKPFCDAAQAYAARDWSETPVSVEPGESPAGIRGEPVEATRAFCREALTWTDQELRARFASGVRVPTRENFGEAQEATPDLAELRSLAGRASVAIQGLPPCLGGPLATTDVFIPPDPEVVAKDGHLNLAPFVAFFIRELYRAKSLRCATCTLDRQCHGLHVNLARIWGLGVLEPVPET